MMRRQLAALAVALLFAGTATACDSAKSTGSADVADSSGPGAFRVPAGLTATCKLLSYASFADPLGAPTDTNTIGNTTSATDTEQTVDCRQDVGHQMNGTPDYSKPGGTVETKLTFWHDVDTSKTELPTEQGTDRDELAKDAATTPVPGVGTEAFRFINKVSMPTVETLTLVVRQSNLWLTVQVDVSSTTPLTDQLLTSVFDRMADYAKAALPVVQHAGTAPTGS
ncbi:hypothetical protein LN042_04965 [Kitasatospora sp. RB6PN24]|uniref:hypothetical protein n=1 Tax=Kitasatospora humi TaxID=2893891 RepID=UPI001E3AC4DF|nr:hypothetical protein [Kitasatospora humi]MCC9306466.1 hypothetical protein [Kitasatospora humi]